MSSKIDSNRLVITPVKVKELEAEEVVFDADKDDDGKGVSLDKMLKMLKSIDNE